MSRRSHLTEVGCITCPDLELLGAGEREGWLDDTSLVAALHPLALALSHTTRSLILILTWNPASPLFSPVKIHPSLSLDDGLITALEFISFGHALALALGTSTGCLLIYSTTADLIHKQSVHPGRVLRLRFREAAGDRGSEELCVVMPGAIARFDGSHLQSLVQRWSNEGGSRLEKGGEDEDSFTQIPFQLWSVNKYGPCTDAAITGLMPPPLLETQLLLLLGSRVSVTTVQLLLERMRWYRHIDCRRIGADP